MKKSGEGGTVDDDEFVKQGIAFLPGFKIIHGMPSFPPEPTLGKK